MKLSRFRPGRRPSAASRRPARRAFTLVEVMIASMVMTILLGGVLALILQSRRLTEGSIVQNSVNTIMQGYIEQIKNMDFASVAVSPAALASPEPTVPTALDEATPDPLTLSWGTSPSSMPAIGSAAPTGAIDNVKNIAIKTPPLHPADTITITIWLWIQDLTGTATNVTGSKSITMIYTYQFRDGGRLRTFRGSVRSIRSVVPTF